MACRGVHFAIREEVARKLMAAPDDDALVHQVQEEIESAWDEAHLFETDKAWDALHRCLSNGTLNADEGAPPLNLCFFGGRMLNRRNDYFVVLLEPKQVREVVQALRGATEPWLRERYFSLNFEGYDGQKSEEDFDYSWGHFEELPAFFETAANEGLYVIFTVDQ